MRCILAATDDGDYRCDAANEPSATIRKHFAKIGHAIRLEDSIEPRFNRSRVIFAWRLVNILRDFSAAVKKARFAKRDFANVEVI